MIQKVIEKKIYGIYAWRHTSVSKEMEIQNLRVTRGNNCLDTCFQYHVKGPLGGQFLNIKIYDKILDLCGRDGYQMIGSRFNRVLGAKRGYDSLIQRLGACQSTGMTRLEVSLCQDAFEFYSPFDRDVMAGWHTKVRNFMDCIQNDVLNSP